MIAKLLGRFTGSECSWQQSNATSGEITACECGNHVSEPGTQISQD